MLDSERTSVAQYAPAITPVNQPYWDGLARGVLNLQRCAGCGSWQFPPAKYCRTCLGDDVHWTPSAGTGRIWSWVRFHKAYLPGYRDTPYYVAMVRMDEGPMLTTRLTEADAQVLDLDSPVQITFTHSADGVVLLGAAPIDA